MKLLSQVGRLLGLLILLVVGIGLIRYVGQQYVGQQSFSGSIGSDSPPVSSEPTPAPVKTASLPEPPSTVPTQPDDNSKAVTPEGNLPRLVTTERGRFIATEPILFNSGASTLREASIPKLDKIAQLLKDMPNIMVEIVGHTDNLGIEPVNQKVSSERAAVVMDYLVSQGIDRSRVKSKGMGSLDPISSNDTQLGRQANRRIEFLITEPGSTR